MRILVFGHMYTESIHREKFQYISRLEEFDVTVIAPALWRHILGNYEFKSATREEVFKVITCKISFSGNYFWFFYHNVSRLLKEYRPDIIEIDQEPASLACYSIIKKVKRFLSSAKIVVWTSEDTVKKWKFPLSYYERYTLLNIDHIIACNFSVERLLREKGYKNKISIFQFLGTSPEIFKKKDVPELKKELNLENKFIVGYVGRLSKGKGLETLLKSFSSLDEGSSLLIVGKGEMLKDLQYLAQQLNISQRVCFAGVVAHEAVPDYINCMDVLALPSEGSGNWQEKFGYVLVQAMLCEVPVIGSRHGGIPDVVADGGLLFEPGNIEELAKKIEMLRNDDNLRRLYIARGKNRALENYTVERVAEKLVKLYRGEY